MTPETLPLVVSLMTAPARASAADPVLAQAAADAKQALRGEHAATEAERIDRGVDQVLRYWRPQDGDATAFLALVRSEFLPQGEPLDGAFSRFELVLERVDGYFVSMVRDLRRGMDLDVGPITALDRRLGEYNPAAHVSDDMFATKLAFVALLNFPLTSLEQRMAEGMGWSRRQWAETRLARRFSTRVPAAVNARLTEAYARVDRYIADYNVYMHHLLARDGTRLFPEGLRLLSHWNLRDELKARYADPQGLARQRLIARVMDRIVRQEIPAAVVNNPRLDWAPETGAVTVSPVETRSRRRGPSASRARSGSPIRATRAGWRSSRPSGPPTPTTPTTRRSSTGASTSTARSRRPR